MIGIESNHGFFDTLILVTNEFSTAMHIPGVRRRRCASSP